VDSNSEIQGYNMHSMLYFHRKFSSGVTTAKKLNRRQACWALHLAQFDFLLYHCLRCTIGKLDVLLRRANHESGALDNENIVLLQLEFLAVCALEGVELTGVEQKILSDICKGN